MPNHGSGEDLQPVANSPNLENAALDQAAIEIMGNNQKIVSIRWLEPSTSAAFAHIIAEFPDGKQKKYFSKCAAGDAGRIMLDGEYHGMFEIYRTMPSLVPRPYGCGHFCKGDDDFYFLLIDYIEMSDKLPDHVALSKEIASLQRKSSSPTGEFGFFKTTCHGQIPQHLNWDSSWTSFYAKLLQDALQKDTEKNGPWPVLEGVASCVLDQVIPRLLGVLESDGRTIRPTLVHGDLWEGNIATRKDTGQILLIDAGAYYAHHEMEIGMWRCQRHAIHDELFKNAYLEQMPKSEPVEEWDDRNRLYCVKMNVIHSAHHRGVVERQTAFEDMCYLVDRYAPSAAEDLKQAGELETFSRAVEEAKLH